MSNLYSESEFYGYTNGKLLWFAHYGLWDLVSDCVFADCGDCTKSEEDDHCSDCIAFKAEPILEKQIIDEGIKFMTGLAKDWRKANRAVRC